MNIFRIIKSDQEQAVASWANYLNQVRIDQLMEALHAQDQNWENAIESLDDALSKIGTEILERNRGGVKGMHGFIAEAAEYGIGNAREQIEGRVPIYEWINDNGPTDLVRNGVGIQQKFVNAGGHLSLRAVSQHFEKYPDYLSQGNKYQIPADHYERIKYLLSIPKAQADRLQAQTGEFSMKQWKEVHEFFENGTIRFEDIEPSILEYDQVQSGRIVDTFQKEKRSIKETDTKLRNSAYEASKPTLGQGAKVAAVSGAIEGGTILVTEIVKKRKAGKRIGDFNTDDWEEVFKKSGLGTIKGGVRGVTIYALTNYTATPAAVASSLCTASFGIAEQAHLLRTGKISETEFIANSEILCVDSAISALSSLVGQSLIPVPVLGAVVGNTVGTLIYQIAKDNLSKREQQLINSYLNYLDEVERALDSKYHDYLAKLKTELVIYYKLLEKAFSPNYAEALEGSAALALSLGVRREELLLSVADVDNYFMS